MRAVDVLETSGADGALSHHGPGYCMRTSEAMIRSAQYRRQSSGTGSLPICPSSPVTSILRMAVSCRSARLRLPVTLAQVRPGLIDLDRGGLLRGMAI